MSQKTAKEIINRIRDRMGYVEVNLEKVVKIPRTERGKFRAVICNLSDKEKKSISQ